MRGITVVRGYHCVLLTFFFVIPLDAGSCIDGRLTSAWNWCNNLEKKRFFPVFLLSGFMGFDGQW